MITIQREVHFQHGRRGRKQIREGAAGAQITGRVPRVARLMALAIRFNRLIRNGDVADQADLARLGHVTRARLTQVMNLLCLAPDIQEAILFLLRTNSGCESITERKLRGIAAVPNWKKQRRMWRELESARGEDPLSR